MENDPDFYNYVQNCADVDSKFAEITEWMEIHSAFFLQQSKGIEEIAEIHGSNYVEFISRYKKLKSYANQLRQLRITLDKKQQSLNTEIQNAHASYIREKHELKKKLAICSEKQLMFKKQLNTNNEFKKRIFRHLNELSKKAETIKEINANAVQIICNVDTIKPEIRCKELQSLLLIFSKKNEQNSRSIQECKQNIEMLNSSLSQISNEHHDACETMESLNDQILSKKAKHQEIIEKVESGLQEQSQNQNQLALMMFRGNVIMKKLTESVSQCEESMKEIENEENQIKEKKVLLNNFIDSNELKHVLDESSELASSLQGLKNTVWQKEVELKQAMTQKTAIQQALDSIDKENHILQEELGKEKSNLQENISKVELAEKQTDEAQEVFAKLEQHLEIANQMKEAINKCVKESKAVEQIARESADVIEIQKVQEEAVELISRDLNSIEEDLMHFKSQISEIESNIEGMEIEQKETVKQINQSQDFDGKSGQEVIAQIKKEEKTRAKRKQQQDYKVKRLEDAVDELSRSVLRRKKRIEKQKERISSHEKDASFDTFYSFLDFIQRQATQWISCPSSMGSKIIEFEKKTIDKMIADLDEFYLL